MIQKPSEGRVEKSLELYKEKSIKYKYTHQKIIHYNMEFLRYSVWEKVLTHFKSP